MPEEEFLQDLEDSITEKNSSKSHSNYNDKDKLSLEENNSDALKICEKKLESEKVVTEANTESEEKREKNLKAVENLKSTLIVFAKRLSVILLAFFIYRDAIPAIMDVVSPDVPKEENGLYELSERNFESHIKTGDHFVKFYAPWCGHCQKLAPVWDSLAKKFEKDEKVKISKLDCTAHRGPCTEFDVKGYPTLIYIRDGKSMEQYRGARTLDDLKDFVETMKTQKSTSASEDGKVPEATPSNVVTLDMDNFEESIKEGIVFVKFYAPWCGHCKRLAPVWDELADKFVDHTDVKIAKVDCTADNNRNKDLCNSHGASKLVKRKKKVTGFPTLNIYKNGEKLEEYNGARKLDDLVKFVHEKQAKKDEL